MMKHSISKLFAISILVTLCIAYTFGDALALVSFTHTHSGNGEQYDDFEISSPESVIMEGKAPADGDLHVQLDAAGNIIVGAFDISDGACHSENLGLLSVWVYEFVSEVSNHVSGVGCAALRNSSLAKLCANCNAN